MRALFVALSIALAVVTELLPAAAYVPLVFEEAASLQASSDNIVNDLENLADAGIELSNPREFSVSSVGSNVFHSNLVRTHTFARVEPPTDNGVCGVVCTYALYRIVGGAEDDYILSANSTLSNEYSRYLNSVHAIRCNVENATSAAATAAAAAARNDTDDRDAAHKTLDVRHIAWSARLDDGKNATSLCMGQLQVDRVRGVVYAATHGLRVHALRLHDGALLETTSAQHSFPPLPTGAVNLHGGGTYDGIHAALLFAHGTRLAVLRFQGISVLGIDANDTHVDFSVVQHHADADLAEAYVNCGVASSLVHRLPDTGMYTRRALQATADADEDPAQARAVVTVPYCDGALHDTITLVKVYTLANLAAASGVPTYFPSESLQQTYPHVSPFGALVDVNTRNLTVRHLRLSDNVMLQPMASLLNQSAYEAYIAESLPSEFGFDPGANEKCSIVQRCASFNACRIWI